MSRFIYAGNGYVNLATVERTRSKRDGRQELIVGDAVIDDNNPDFPNELISIIPVQGEWECLLLGEEEDGSTGASSHPVIAWGFTVLGKTVPVTPFDLGGVEFAFGLRRTGYPTVYASGIEYSDLESWLKAQTKNPE